MVISSNTLFHFTDSIDNLANILSNEFRPHLSLENIESVFPGDERTIPMVSFCDLPLSQVGEHLKFYGNYGIGMQKEWGIKNGVNPVMYLQPQSYLAKHLVKLIKTTMRSKNYYEIGRIVFEIVSFMKDYEGVSYRQGSYSGKRIFYNEREWRFVPSDFETMSFEEFLLSFFLTKEAFEDPHKRQVANEKLSSAFRLSFEPSNIKYIIVSSESEILPMTKAIKEIKGPKYSYDLLQILTTRIMSAEQITEDF